MSDQMSNPQSDAILFHNARLIDPSIGLDGPGWLKVENGQIHSRGEGLVPAALLDGADAVIEDLGGKVLAPGLWDVHVHFREPGQEDKEDIASGALAAAKGGFTSVVAMPNTSPAIDTAGTVHLVKNRSAQAGLCHVLPSGAITRGLGGTEMVEYADLVQAGAVAFTDDGRPVADGGLMRRAMAYSKILGVPMITHAEDLTLSRGGAMHEGAVSTRLGLPGIPYAAEETCIARDIELARLTGAHLHIAHISSAGGVELLRRAKADGLRVTGETAPHFLCFTDEDCVSYNTHFKMNPPLRTARDQEALIEALQDGTIDLIATDHAPHTHTEKDAPFAEAPFGVIGLESSFPASCGRLVGGGFLSLSKLIELMSTAGPRMLGLEGGTLAEGRAADLVCLDPDAKWILTTSDLGSKSRNCPWLGRELQGRVEGTWLAGKPTFRRDSVSVAQA